MRVWEHVAGLLLAASLLVGAGSAAAAEESPLSGIREGHWLEVRGHYLGGGRFEASRVDIIHSQRYQVLIGTVADKGKKEGFVLLDRSVEVVDKTEFGKVDAGRIAGQRVKVEGYYLGGNRFTAREVAPRGPGRERISGRADRVRSVDGGLEVALMNFTVLIPADLMVRHEDPLDSYVLSESRTQPVGRESRNEDDLFGEGLRITENLLFAGLLEGRWTGENNFNLNDRRPRDRQDTEGSARVRFIYRPSDSFIGVAELRYQGQYRDDDEDGRFYEDGTRLGETFGYWVDPLQWNLDLQLGRIDFDDEREWLYDQNLDGIRLFHFNRFFVTEFSVSTTLSDGSPRDENAVNSMLYISNGNEDRHVAAYIVHRDFDLAVREKQTHLGVRVLGEWLPKSKGWLEISRMTGELGTLETGGWGYDVGNTLSFDSGFNVTLGYAWGEGDDTSTSRVENFRQTGLQDNNAKLAGVTSFRYYGELADPELVNLRILTAGLGYRFPRRISIDLVGHQYRQDQLSRRWIGSDIDKRPNGRDKDLGWELDFILGWRTHPSWDMEIVAAWFRPGKAFDDADDAFLGKFQLRYRF
jgi:alginate production protein